jgi:hypothetical protein
VESYKDGELVSIESYQTKEIVYNPGEVHSAGKLGKGLREN